VQATGLQDLDDNLGKARQLLDKLQQTYQQLLQEHTGLQAADVKVYNMGALVKVAQAQLAACQTRYDDLFDSVKTTVSRKFRSYMHRHDHLVGGKQLVSLACCCIIASITFCEVSIQQQCYQQLDLASVTTTRKYVAEKPAQLVRHTWQQKQQLHPRC
jgi:citrate lyase gamma subunit